VVLAAAVALPVILAVDRLLSREDRIRFVGETMALAEVRGAILEFKLDREQFPRVLAELVPGYLPVEMTRVRPDPRTDRTVDLAWDPTTGVLSWTEPLQIRGVLPRRRHLALTVPNLPISRDPLSATAVFGQPPGETELSAEDIVVEAEVFQFLSYGWEIGEDARCAGSAFIYLKEGVGDVSARNVEFDPKLRAGDFYNITGDRRRIEARSYFAAPAAGRYFVAARTMAHRSHCSNIVYIKINDGPHRPVGHNGSTPFVWLWHRVGEVSLRKGLNTISFLTCQDGVKVDQVILTRTDPGLAEPDARAFSGGCTIQPELPPHTPPVTLSLATTTLALTEPTAPLATVYVRRNVPEAVRGTLKLSLDLPGHRKLVESHDLVLTGARRLVKLPFSLKLPRPLEKREYLARCQFLQESRAVQDRTLVFYQEYDWSILGPLPFMGTTAVGQPETDPRPRKHYTFGGRTFTWKRYDRQFSDAFCVMDFGRMFCGRTFNAVPNVSLYAYTEVEVERGGPYLLKAQGDDYLMVWVNGRHVATTGDHKGTAIRTARQIPIELIRGRNRILFRLNQKTGQWQAGIRIRTQFDKVADVTGIPFARQDLAADDTREWRTPDRGPSESPSE